MEHVLPVPLLQRVCYGQHGVRKNCVLSLRLFFAASELAMRKWKHAIGQAGIDLMDGSPNLFDIHFADDILILPAHIKNWGNSLIDSLVLCLERVGLFLNAKKTVVLINEAQPPPILAVECLSKGGWVACWQVIITTHRFGISFARSLRQPLEFLDTNIPISKLPKVVRCRDFKSAFWQRTQGNLQLLSADCFGNSFSKMMQVNRRTAVGSWFECGLEQDFASREWRGQIFWCKYPREHITCKNYCNLARHVANLPVRRWIQPLLSWHPLAARRGGRPPHTWGVKTSDIAVRGSSFLRSERKKKRNCFGWRGVELCKSQLYVVWNFAAFFFSMVSLRGCDNLHHLPKIFGNSRNAPVLSPINANKRGDVIGILVTLLPVVPRIFLRDLLHLNNVVLITCYIPGRKIKNWRKKKTFRPKAFTDLGSNQHWIPGFMLAAHWRCILRLQTWWLTTCWVSA